MSVFIIYGSTVAKQRFCVWQQKDVNSHLGRNVLCLSGISEILNSACPVTSVKMLFFDLVFGKLGENPRVLYL